MGEHGEFLQFREVAGRWEHGEKRFGEKAGLFGGGGFECVGGRVGRKRFIEIDRRRSIIFGRFSCGQTFGGKFFWFVVELVVDGDYGV